MHKSDRQNVLAGTVAKLAAFAGVALIAGSSLANTIQRPATASASQKGTETPPAGAARLQVFKLPMRFEPNQGQSDSPVKFVARGNGYGLFLTKDEALLALSERSATKPATLAPNLRPVADAALDAAGKAAADVLRIKLRDANQNPQIEALDPLVSKSNYLLGNDPRNWRTGVPNYARVAYREVYPGIDLIYHGDGRQLEYDFVVAPGRDVRKIRLSIAGARQVTIGADGQLHMRVGASEVVEHAPVAYQQIGDVRRLVQSAFVRGADNTISFQLASYDRNLPLTIDPVLVYSTYLGGSDADRANGIALDPGKNAYIVGTTGQIALKIPIVGNFPTTAGALQATFQGTSSDAFVTKLNSDGSLAYSTFLGGDGFSQGSAIKVDSSGNAYVTGATYAPDFPVTSGAFQTTLPAPTGFGSPVAAFVSKLNATGSALIYSTFLGGTEATSQAYGFGVALDPTENAYVTGWVSSATFPTTPGVLQPTSTNKFTGFVSKFNSDGTALVYSTYFGNSDTFPVGIALDSSQNVYLTGNTTDAAFPTTPGAPQRVIAGGSTTYFGPDAFISKMNSAGTALIYSTFLGQRFSDQGNGIAADSSDNAWIVGTTSSPHFLSTPNAAQKHPGGGTSDAFLAELNPTGTKFLYVSFLGGSGVDEGLAITLDDVGDVYVGGATKNGSFPQSPNAIPPATGTAFVAEFNSFGQGLFATRLGGNGNDQVNSIAVDSLHRVYVAGFTGSSNLTVTPGAAQTTYDGNGDAFVTKLTTK